MIGARVIKTSISVAISILIARSLDLQVPHFAGIISLLAVQPSIYRSLRNGIQQIISAIVGALIAAFALYVVGDSFLIMGVVTFLLMGLHVILRWTNSLLIAVVIAINTMGSAGLTYEDSALNQIALVLIGIVVGNLINLLQKPVHTERAESLLLQSEAMLRALLYYLYFDLQQNRITSYKDVMKQQIEHVRIFIEKGKEISSLINEDKRYPFFSAEDAPTVFYSFDSMVERIRDMSKELQKAHLGHEELESVKKAISLTIRVQELSLKGKNRHSKMLKRAIENRRKEMWSGHTDYIDLKYKLPFYNFYGYLKDYIREIEGITQKKERSSIKEESEPVKAMRFNIG